MSDCIFCKIIAGEIPSERVGENELAIAFRDISPLAPTHVLVIPRKHIASFADVCESDSDDVLAMLALARSVAEEEGLTGGYRLVTNVGEAAGQTVHHLHWHVLGGKRLGSGA